jgi:hypothetical protein
VWAELVVSVSLGIEGYGGGGGIVVVEAGPDCREYLSFNPTVTDVRSSSPRASVSSGETGTRITGTSGR